MSEKPADELFLFDAETSALIRSARAVEPAVIDSFVVAGGRARGLDKHVRRFAASCAVWRDVDETTIRRFVDAVAEEIPLTGEWFPRLELLDQPIAQLAFRSRPAPPRRATAKVWLGAEQVSRRAPKVKGPDLHSLAEVRGHACRAGADEALLMSPEGYLLESSQSSVLWWRDDVLCAVPDDAAALPGITRDLLIEMAAGEGHPIRYELVRPAELDGLEVWLVNALHGLRPITEWVGVTAGEPIRSPLATRAADWDSKLQGVAEPIGRR